MPHKPEILQRVISLLEHDYPQKYFEYRLDTSRLFDGSRMFPDVQIFSSLSKNKPICVVEIGYTRPEKLAHYKNIGIKDIRWYGRDDGILYNFNTIKPASCRIQLDFGFNPPKNDSWYNVNFSGCWDCTEKKTSLYDLREHVKTIPSTFGKLKEIIKYKNFVLEDHIQEFDDDKDFAHVVLCPDEEYSDFEAQLFTTDVYLSVWSNGISALLELFCDFCGDHIFGLTHDYNQDAIEMDLDEQCKTFTHFVAKSCHQRRETARLLNLKNDDGELILEKKKTSFELAEYILKCDTRPIKQEPSFIVDLFNDAFKFGTGLNWSKVTR